VGGLCWPSLRSLVLEIPMSGLSGTTQTVDDAEAVGAVCSQLVWMAAAWPA
jgi:hypothetical protein